MRTRRHLLQAMAASGGALMLPGLARAAIEPSFVTMGYTLGIHVPSHAAMSEILPELRKSSAPRVTGIEQIQTITQSVIAGSSLFAASDFLSTVKACQSGADLAVVGNVYVNTSLVLVVNSQKIATLPDLLKPDVMVAVNGTSDGTFVSWAGALVDAGLDPKKLHTIEVGGSGSRARALLSHRIDATPVHFDQAEQLEKAGGFKTLIEPWKTFHPWMNEVWVTQASKLADPEHQRLVVDLLKASLIAFRKASSDFGWYAERYRRYATVPNAGTIKDDDIRHLWETLSGPVGAWPADMNFSIPNAEKLVPAMKGTGAVPAPVDFKKIMRPEFLDQALKELG